MKFTLVESSSQSKARAGLIETDHGQIETPIFMPVGTAGTVKGVDQNKLREDVKAQIILGNTYHLFLRPGLDIIREAGGLHKFISWDRPLLTDSGGYQVYSLSGARKIKEEGVDFQSHIDGSKHHFSPENVMETQRIIGADIIMAFDECTPYPCDKGYAKKSMKMTHRWLDRCLKAFKEGNDLYGYKQSLFPIIQGSVYPDLRKESAEFICSRDAEGYAIGGLSVGEPHEDLYAMTDLCTEIMPSAKPRYLMGVGTPVNLLESIERGIDMFDCVMPTRNARNGMLFTSRGIINIRNNKWKNVFEPIDPGLDLKGNQGYTLAYLRHLIISKEILGAQIASLQNLSFYLWLMRMAREKILEGSFESWKAAIVPTLEKRL